MCGDHGVCNRGFWLRKGLVVKIMSAELKSQGLYKKKGNVVRLVNEQVTFMLPPEHLPAASQGAKLPLRPALSHVLELTTRICNMSALQKSIQRFWSTADGIGLRLLLAGGAQVGEVELTDGSAAVQIHQSQLETVIPQPGGTVMLLAGPHRGTLGTLVSIILHCGSCRAGGKATTASVRCCR